MTVTTHGSGEAPPLFAPPHYLYGFAGDGNRFLFVRREAVTDTFLLNLGPLDCLQPLLVIGKYRWPNSVTGSLFIDTDEERIYIPEPMAARVRHYPYYGRHRLYEFDLVDYQFEETDEGCVRASLV